MAINIPTPDRVVRSRPSKRTLQETRRLNRVRERLQAALRTSKTIGQLRSAVVCLASDLEEFCNLDPPSSEHGALTVRQPTAPAESARPVPDSAPPTDLDSPLGQEYGP